MSKLEKLIKMCKCGVFVTVNEHRDYYEKAEEFLAKRLNNQEKCDEIRKEVWDKMVETDTVVNVHVYPDTPIRFYDAYHYDLDKALDIVIEEIHKAQQEKIK